MRKAKDDDKMHVAEYEQYLTMMNQWFILAHEGKGIDRFIRKQGWQSVAVYGMAIYGRHVIRELKKTSCIVVYGIDRKKMEQYEGIRILKPTDHLPDVDVVINSVIHRHGEIMGDLIDIILCPVVSLEDVVFGSY